MVEGENNNQRATADALLLLATTTKRKKQTTTEENRGEITKKPKHQEHTHSTTDGKGKVLPTTTKPTTRAMTAAAEVQKTNTYAVKKKGTRSSKTKSTSNVVTGDQTEGVVLPPLVSHIKRLKHFLFPLIDANLFGVTEKYEFLPVSPSLKDMQ